MTSERTLSDCVFHHGTKCREREWLYVLCGWKFISK